MQLAQMMHWKKKVSIEDAVFFGYVQNKVGILNLRQT